jgi:hypothetical protein
MLTFASALASTVAFEWVDTLMWAAALVLPVRENESGKLYQN